MTPENSEEEEEDAKGQNYFRESRNRAGLHVTIRLIHEFPE